jgi:hypothetical protein
MIGRSLHLHFTHDEHHCLVYLEHHDGDAAALPGHLSLRDEEVPSSPHLLIILVSSSQEGQGSVVVSRRRRRRGRGGGGKNPPKRWNALDQLFTSAANKCRRINFDKVQKIHKMEC